MARLAGVPGVNTLNTDIPPLGFISDAGPEVGKRPAMQAALATVGSARLDTGANVGQVLDRDGRARGHTIHDAPTDDVIVVAASPCRRA